MSTKDIKILIAYHKPYRLIKNDIFVPIHVGREIAFEKSKDGIISNEDFKWLEKNCIGDNTGENISSLNREFCELTATYWAWKNYNTLGNPDYIGLMHYRTFFDLFNDNLIYDLNIGYNNIYIEKILNNYHGIISQSLNTITDFETPWSFNDSNNKYWHLSNNYHKDLYEMILKYNNNIHFKNMFILTKEDFFEYCDCIFSILFDIKEKYHNDYDINSPRMLGRHAEGLSSLFFMHLINNKKRKLLELPWLLISDKKNNKIIPELIYKQLFILTKKQKFYNKFLHYKKKNI